MPARGIALIIAVGQEILILASLITGFVIRAVLEMQVISAARAIPTQDRSSDFCFTTTPTSQYNHGLLNDNK
jgi:hypothetical protein